MTIRTANGRRWIAFTLLTAALWGCGGQEIVAQVGPRSISEEALKSYVLGLGESQKSRKEGPAERQDYLQPLIDYELMWLDAKALGLDTSATIQRQLERKIRKSLVALYLERKAVQPPLVSEGEIEQRFGRRGPHREPMRRTWGIMTKTRSELERGVAELEAGALFSEVAARYTITPDAAKGGELGWLGVESTRRMGIPDSLFYGLPLGALSAVLLHSEGFFVVRFTEEQPVEYLDFRGEILQELREEKRSEARAARAEQLAREYDWQPHGPGLRWLLEKGRGPSTAALKLTPEEERMPLFLFEGGQVQVGDLLYELETNKVNASLADSAALVNLAERFLLQPYIFAAAARHQDLIDEEALEETRRRLRDEVILSELRRQKVVESIAITPEAMRRFYDEQPQRFYRRDQIDVAEVLVETQEGALAVRQQIETGAAIAEIARERSKRRGARARGGIFPMEKTSDLVPHIMAAQAGELVGPVEVHDGFSVFEIVRQEKGERMPFDQVRRQIKGILRRAEERQRFQTYIEDLRRQYADQIQVDQERLAEALPDEFLTAF